MTDTIEEERKEAVVKVLARRWAGVVHNLDDGTWAAEQALTDLLAYFDEHEPAVADAIRYGLVEIADAGWTTDEFGERGFVTRASYVGRGRPKGSVALYRIAKDES